MNSTSFSGASYAIFSAYFVQSFCCLTFSLLAIFVLLYQIKWRFLLYKQIRWNPPARLHYWFNYRNHVKNLKIKVCITNFTIVILLIEIVNNIASFFTFVILCLRHFNKNAFEDSYWYFHQIGFITYFCYLPILCLLMNVLWLVYLHTECKNSIKRWTAYIFLRLIAIYIVYSWQYWEYATDDKDVYKYMYSSIYWVTRVTFEIIDLVTYVRYSKRFYLHLRSRVLEARAVGNKREYKQNNSVCLHFKIATRLVVIAFLLHTIGDVNYLIDNLTYEYSKDSPLKIFTINEWRNILQDEQIPLNIFNILYRMVLNFNYFSVSFAIIVRKCMQEYKKSRVNETIRPIMDQYRKRTPHSKDYTPYQISGKYERRPWNRLDGPEIPPHIQGLDY